MIGKVSFFVAAAAATTVALFACSSSSPSGGSSGASPFIGSYGSCTLTPDVNITAPVTLAYTTPIVGGDATIAGTGDALTAVLSSDAGLNCSIAITANGDAATVNAGQTCDLSLMGIAVVITFTGGTVDISGSTLTTTAQVTIAGPGDAAASVAGTGSLTATCTKS